ncbi:MAG: ATP phosphoribosyltransferase regulatory subunit [Lachnospiraceae bacterium]|nr:ATP phosphoribosyltransferase regulatory subunit [Lachnospiraceae bacterium]
MKKVLVHTPEGVRDIYNKECERKLYLQQTVHNVLKKYGYNDIQTPSFEFFDIFSKEKGTVASNKMYKFFDREGNTLVLRPDMTPPMARCVSKYYMDEEMPIRLCYSGQTFINSAEHQGKLKECTQIGAELYGENKADSDCETLAIIIESLLACGLTEFQIEVGHTLFFEGLINEAKLEEEEEDELRQLVENKNFFGMEEYLSNIGMDEDLKEIFIQLPELIGSGDMIARAKKLISNEKIDTALSRLEKVYKLLSYYGYEKYVSFDLSTVANRNYYTGIIFAGYTYGTGEAIVTGGRYDNLLKQFGKDTPSIGFAIDLDRLLISMMRQKISIPIETKSILILYENNAQKEAIDMASQYRKDGIYVTLICKRENASMEGYKKYARRNEFTKMYYMSDANAHAEKIELY